MEPGTGQTYEEQVVFVVYFGCFEGGHDGSPRPAGAVNRWFCM